MWRADANLPVQGPDGQKPLRPQLRTQQISVKEMARSQPGGAWQMITWRENGEAFMSRFARLQVRPVTRAINPQPAEAWLLIDGPPTRTSRPTLVATLPADISFEARVHPALADRARLSGPQAGTWPGSLRRTRMARATPPRNAVHSSLRIADCRTGDFSPLRTPKTQQIHGGWQVRRSPIRRRLRCTPNGIFRTPSPRSGDGSLSLCSSICHVVSAAARIGRRRSGVMQ
jgi:hypothetical protein